MNRKSIRPWSRARAGVAMVPFAVLGGLSFAPPAQAALMVTLSEVGFAPVTATDGDLDGQVSFAGAYGDFKTNIVVGFSNKLEVTHGPEAELQIQSLDITKNTGLTSVPAVLTITVVDDGFLFPGGAGSPLVLFSALGGTLKGSAAGDSVTFQSFADPGGSSPGPQTYVSPGGAPPSTPVSFNVPDATVAFVRGLTYDLRSVTTISLTNGNESSNLSGSTTVSVPEPSAALFGMLSSASLLLHRRRKPAR